MPRRVRIFAFAGFPQQLQSKFSEEHNDPSIAEETGAKHRAPHYHWTDNYYIASHYFPELIMSNVM